MEDDRPGDLTPESSPPRGAPDAGMKMTGGKKAIFAVVGSVVGAIMGVLIVRLFFLDGIQIMGLSMGWNAFWHGEMDSYDLGFVFRSVTFYKCLAGLIAGGVAGGLIGAVVSKKFSPSGGGSL